MRERIAAGVVHAETLPPDTVNKVQILRLADGSRVIRKTPHEGRRSAGNAQAQYDAEELGGAVARAVGLPAPATYRDADDSIYMDYVEGAKLADDVPGYRKLDLPATVDGARLGLLDLLIFNYDRHAGNWFITDDDRIIPIDHGAGWGDSSVAHPKSPPMAPQGSFERLYTYNPWDEGIEPEEGNEDSHWVRSNPVSQQSMQALRQRLEALRPEFVRLQRPDWYDAMMERMTVLQQRAWGRMEL